MLLCAERPSFFPRSSNFEYEVTTCGRLRKTVKRRCRMLSFWPAPVLQDVSF